MSAPGTGAQTRLPPSPAGLQATAGNARVGLMWGASSGATTYHLKRATADGGPYSQIAAPSTATYTDTGLANGTAYYYVVSAVDSAGKSADSAQATAMPVAPVQVPIAPTGLQAGAGNAQVSLTWSATAGAASYHVKRSTISGGPYAQVAGPTAPPYTDTGLTNGITYYYVVSALDSAGESANSAPASALPVPAVNVTVTINPTKTTPISPFIYGINYGVTSPQADLTFARRGGNRWTAYNWETNASNAGSDYYYQNDNFLSGSAAPAEAVRSFIAGNQATGMASLFCIQMQGLVAADQAGPVSTSNPPDLTRFKQVVNKKNSQSASPFTTAPPTTDPYVYLDEYLWSIDQLFAGQSIFGPHPNSQHTFVELDNEPELWNSTHLEIQGPNPVTTVAYIAKTISLAEALKDQFPDLVIFGPVHFGFGGIYNWQGELAATPTGSNWFPDKYLPAIHSASAVYGKPLVDVYDFHWYSEATDGSGNRVTTMTSPTLTDAQVQAIVQSPRSLWDTAYTENSWITGALGGPIYILGRLQSRIAAKNPGMRLAITEYNNGGSQHIAGTLAQADNLGIFGAQGLFAATLWSLSSSEPYILAGFSAFRNFDGAHSSFGDTSKQASSSNVQNVTAYASTDSTRPGRVVVVAINRSTTAQVTAITGAPLSGTAHLYQMTAATAASQSAIHPVAAGTLTPTGASLTVTLPALSVTTIDVF